ncbi:ImpE/SciE family protein [Caballeronia novacaledonica]|uniref:type VI secretion system accessory protein TagJ n=1 Tax=Caballeronia novacaledonica TaxID=1544861 RepID=UPI001EE38F88|nr:type VI secretion system accessory protein TagJ [Caballeronia novacaledonica]GJH07356.1 ImpE/SciE family protein [Caballeronia novacaledonica]
MTSLEQQIHETETQIRAQPANTSHRWALFQLLCMTGDWARAMQQLQLWAKLGKEQDRIAQVFRDLVRAERWRAKVLDGHEKPSFVLEPPAWIEGLSEALRLSAEGRIDEADAAREAALDAAPLTAARTPQGVAEWVADSDSRLGPVFEIITAGHYRWVPFADIATWHVTPPSALIDLIWAPCVLTLIDGSTVRGFVPARYPGSETGSDAIRRGRETLWREAGRTGVIALGQKTWATAQGDFGVFDWLLGDFGARATADAQAVREDVHDPS